MVILLVRFVFTGLQEKGGSRDELGEPRRTVRREARGRNSRKGKRQRPDFGGGETIRNIPVRMNTELLTQTHSEKIQGMRDDSALR